MTKNEESLPIEQLKKLIRLNRETGELFWNKRTPDMFNDSAKRSKLHKANNWNSKNAYRPALNCVDGSGHLVGRINGKSFYSHRVVFALVNGYWPIGSIDHINGVSIDNIPENIRDVTHYENLKNQAKPKNNTSGIVGVRFYRPRSKWAASITHKGKQIHLGYFLTKSEAELARKNAESKYGFHKNHGAR